MEKVVRVSMSWSGGKDSALALHRILKSKKYIVESLHTVFGEETKRVGLHGVRELLIEQQAWSLGIPLQKLYLKSSDNHAAYEKLMKAFYQDCADRKLEGIVFGDIFLEDLKRYREELLEESGLVPIYPLWKEDTRQLLDEFIGEGFKTVLCSANASHFSEAQLGRVIDENFVKHLPPSVDPCGENGEFHTFVFDGPVFKNPVLFQKDEITSKHYSYQKKNADGSVEKSESDFWFQELLPLMAS